MGNSCFFYLAVLNNIFPGWRTDCLRSAADAFGTFVYSLQGSQEVGRKVILLQTSTIRRMSPTRRTLRIWTDLCREWSLRRLLLLLPQGVITAAIKNERIKTDTGQWQGPPLSPSNPAAPTPLPRAAVTIAAKGLYTRVKIRRNWCRLSVAHGEKLLWSKWNRRHFRQWRNGWALE